MSPKPVTLKQCFRSYNERFPKSNGPTARQFLGKFTEAAKEQTVQGWLTEKSMPLGEYKWRCIAFFALLGYPIEPYVRVRPIIQRAIELLALDVVPVQTLVSKGFCFESSNATGEMYVVIEKNRAMLPEREIALERFFAEYTEDLLIAKQLFSEAYGTAALETTTSQAEPTPPQAVTPSLEQRKIARLDPKPAVPEGEKTGTKLSRKALIQSTAYLILALEPNLELLASDTFSAAERATLRDLTGGDGIFKVSNYFEKLCSEQARKQTI
jgi:hypothetical protein